MDSALLSVLLNAGAGFLVILLIVFGFLVPKPAADHLLKEKDEWKSLYEKERDAHQATRDALVLASQRSDAGVEAAKVTSSLIDALREQGKRRDDDR